MSNKFVLWLCLTAGQWTRNANAAEKAAAKLLQQLFITFEALFTGFCS